MSNILVTGGAGFFIPSCLIAALLKDGHKIISVDNFITGKKRKRFKP